MCTHNGSKNRLGKLKLNFCYYNMQYFKWQLVWNCYVSWVASLILFKDFFQCCLCEWINLRNTLSQDFFESYFFFNNLMLINSNTSGFLTVFICFIKWKYSKISILKSHLSSFCWRTPMSVKNSLTFCLNTY